MHGLLLFFFVVSTSTVEGLFVVAGVDWEEGVARMSNRVKEEIEGKNCAV